MSSPSPISTVSQEESAPTVEEGEAGEGAILRSLEFWLTDGDVVLQVEKTQFRVHRSMLSRHSNVFRDMFNMPQKTQDGPDDVGVTVEGCPLVCLSDKADEVNYVISIFYDGFKIHDWRKPMSFRDLAALLRLGKKYEIDHLSGEALRRLRVDHPITLAGWEKIGDINKYQELDFGSEEDNFRHDIDIINLAHEQSVPSILPAAYLRCILSGYELEDFLNTSSTPRLCPEAQHNCVVGRDRLMRAVHFHHKQWRNRGDLLPSTGCSSREACVARQAKAIDALPLWASIYDDTLFAPLEKEAVAGLCVRCTKTIRAKYSLTREELWDQLPRSFNLSEWKDLKDFDM